MHYWFHIDYYKSTCRFLSWWTNQREPILRYHCIVLYSETTQNYDCLNNIFYTFLYSQLFIQSISVGIFLRNINTLFSASFFFCFWGILEFFFPDSSSLRASLNRDMFFTKNRSHRTHTLCLLSNKMTHQPHNKEIHTFTIAEKFFILTFIFHSLLFTFCLLFKSHNKILKGFYICLSFTCSSFPLSHSFVQLWIKGVGHQATDDDEQKGTGEGGEIFILRCTAKAPNTLCTRSLSLSHSPTHIHLLDCSPGKHWYIIRSWLYLKP